MLRWNINKITTDIAKGRMFHLEFLDLIQTVSKWFSIKSIVKLVILLEVKAFSDNYFNRSNAFIHWDH